jgi:integrase
VPAFRVLADRTVGVPISIVSRWAGHASPEFTYRVYVHAHDDDLAVGRDALSRVYGG